MKLGSNQVTGFVCNDTTTGAWWIMADGSKHSGAPRDVILAYLQHVYNDQQSVEASRCMRYVWSGIRRIVYEMWHFYWTSKWASLRRMKGEK